MADFANWLLETRIETLPQIFLWPHSGCNCRCVMCDIWKDTSRTMISLSDVRSWAQEFEKLDVRCVVLTGGEATMHSEIWEICKILRSAGIAIFLLSTGVSLRRHAAEVVANCDALSVSLDGPPAVHNAIRRVPKAYEFLRASVHEVRRLRPSFPIFGRSAVHRLNFRHLRQTVAYAHDDLRLNHISFLATDTDSEAFNRSGGWSPNQKAGLLLDETELPDLEKELNALERECGAEFASRFIAESAEELRSRLLEFYRAHCGLGSFPVFPCNAPWASAVIEPNGDVRPCFFQPPYGNIHEFGGLEEVLNSPSALRFRDELDIVNDPVCERCVCRQTIQ